MHEGPHFQGEGQLVSGALGAAQAVGRHWHDAPPSSTAGQPMHVGFYN